MANRRKRNNVGADDIAQAIHRMVDVMQPIAAPPRAIVAPTRPVSMEDFMRHRPTKFSSKATPDEADAWLRECEKICRVHGCSKTIVCHIPSGGRRRVLVVGDAAVDADP